MPHCLQVLLEQLTRRGEAAAPMQPMVRRMTADVQGRLAFKGQALIRDAVLHYKPSAADLNYPALLQQVLLMCMAPCLKLAGRMPCEPG